jgi:hypothetical protein
VNFDGQLCHLIHACLTNLGRITARAKRAKAPAVPQPGVGAAVGGVRPAKAGPGGVRVPGAEEEETQWQSQLPESAPNVENALPPGVINPHRRYGDVSKQLKAKYADEVQVRC